MGILKKYANSTAVETALDKGVQGYDKAVKNETDILSVREDIGELKGEIFNTDNLLLTAEIVPDKYYAGVEEDNSSYTYAIIPMVSGKTYVISKARFIADKTSLITQQIPNGYEFTPTTDGDIYITFYKDTKTNGEWRVYEKGKDSEKIGTYQNPAFSQNAINQIAASPVDIKRISGIKIKDGTDLSPLIVEQGDYGYVAQTVGGVIQPITYEGYKYFKLPINGANRYYLDDTWRWWFATDINGVVVDSSGSGANLTDLTITSANAVLLWVTYKAVEPNLTTRKIAVGSIPTDTIYLFPDNVETNINPEATSGNVGNKIYGKGFAQASGNLNDGDILTVPKTNLKKNNVYSFMASITTMGTILIGHGKNTYSGSWIEINDTNVISHSYNTTDSTITYPHGLTISGYIYVQVIVKIGKADINIYSNGQVYTITDAVWNGDGNGHTFVESVGSILTECIFTWSSEDFRKSIWMFGDSYFGMTSSSRWVKYLVDAGYADNVLLNAYPGESTTQATPPLKNMIEHYGTPNFIVWCLGMNDGSDADESTPTTKWSDGINYVLNICNEHGITPIFATIPTVPNINHEGKNNFIRNSGYRYIDFAKAVNAQPDGTWISGMLGSDNVHPSETGARALYFRAIADCPEITFGNP